MDEIQNLKINKIKNAKSLEEFINNIYPPNKDHIFVLYPTYREWIYIWIDSYQKGIKPEFLYAYKTPQELIENIWKPILDKNNEKYYKLLRKVAIKWIYKYKKSYKK
jgi:hypothetical protein